MKKSSQKIFIKYCIIVFIAVLILKIIYLIDIRDNPFFSTPIVDSRKYIEKAENIAKGLGYGNEPYFQAPLYVYYLAFIIRIFGKNYVAIRFITSLIGSLNCVLLFLISIKVIGRKFSVISVILAAFYWMFLFFDAEVLAPTIFIFFILSGFYFLILGDRSGKIKMFTISGILLGLAALTRANISLFFPAIFIKQILEFKKLKIKKFILINTGFYVPIIILISICALRNYYVGNDLVLFTSNGGINFYIGNNKNMEETIKIRPGIAWEKLSVQPFYKNINYKESEVSGFYFKKAFTFIQSNKMLWLKNCFKKLIRLISGYEIVRILNPYFFKRYSFILRNDRKRNC